MPGYDIYTILTVYKMSAFHGASRMQVLIIYHFFLQAVSRVSHDIAKHLMSCNASG